MVVSSALAQPYHAVCHVRKNGASGMLVGLSSYGWIEEAKWRKVTATLEHDKKIEMTDEDPNILGTTYVHIISAVERDDIPPFPLLSVISTP